MENKIEELIYNIREAYNSQTRILSHENAYSLKHAEMIAFNNNDMKDTLDKVVNEYKILQNQLDKYTQTTNYLFEEYKGYTYTGDDGNKYVYAGITDGYYVYVIKKEDKPDIIKGSNFKEQLKQAKEVAKEVLNSYEGEIGKKIIVDFIGKPRQTDAKVCGSIIVNNNGTSYFSIPEINKTLTYDQQMYVAKHCQPNRAYVIPWPEKDLQTFNDSFSKI